MKPFLILSMLLISAISSAQSDFTGKIIHFKNSYTDSSPGGKIFIADAAEDTLYLPSAASATNKMFVLKPQNYIGYVRLNTTVYYTPDGLGRTTLWSSPTSSTRNYIYSNGVIWKWAPSINWVDSTTFLPIAQAIDANGTTSYKTYPYTIQTSDYNTVLDFSTTSSAEKLNLPNPVGLAPISFRIINHGYRPLQTNYPLYTEGKVNGVNSTNRNYTNSLTNTEFGNTIEVLPEAGIYRIISK